MNACFLQLLYNIIYNFKLALSLGSSHAAVTQHVVSFPDLALREGEKGSGTHQALSGAHRIQHIM